MKKLLTFAVIVFMSFSAQAQYSYKLKGTKVLVGQNRGFYGSVGSVEAKKLAEGCPFHATQNNNQVILLGDAFPQMGTKGSGLLWNFDSKKAHLTELDGAVRITKEGGCVYAEACKNLLVLEEVARIPEKVNTPPAMCCTTYVPPSPPPVVDTPPPAKTEFIRLDPFQKFETPKPFVVSNLQIPNNRPPAAPAEKKKKNGKGLLIGIGTGIVLGTLAAILLKGGGGNQSGGPGGAPTTPD